MQPPPVTPVEAAIGKWVAPMASVDLGKLHALSADMNTRTATEIAQEAEQLALAAQFLSEATRLRLEELRSND